MSCLSMIDSRGGPSVPHPKNPCGKRYRHLITPVAVVSDGDYFLVQGHRFTAFNTACTLLRRSCAAPYSSRLHFTMSNRHLMS